jgi:site-specific recombinase XerD
MATIKLYLDTRRAKADGTFSIRLAVNNHGETAFISLGQSVKKDEWDKRQCRIKKRPDRDFLNDYLRDRYDYYNRILMRLQMSEDYRGDISARQLRDNIIREAAGKKSATLKDMFVRYTSREMGNKTKKNYSVTWNTIAQFDKTSETLLLDDVSRDWLERYNLFLLNIGNCHNTRTVRIRHIAAVFNYAIDNELTTNYPFRRLDLSIEPTKKRDLKVEELREVFSANIKEKDRKLLDAFKVMFMLIGINVHDLYNLTRDNIVDGRMEYKRLKTGKQYSILIQPEVTEIINKYPGKDRLFSFCEHYANASSFGMVTNIFLKRIRAGLTTYYARHTWATLAFKLGIPKDTISLALGHSFGVRVTGTYINADLSRVDEANRKVIDYVLYGKE